MKLRQPGANFIGVKVGDPEVKVIDGSGLTFALFNAKEGRSHTQDMYFCRLLPKWHPKELLIELGRAVKVRNSHGDMVQTDSTKARWVSWSREHARSRERACSQGGKGTSDLAAR